MLDPAMSVDGSRTLVVFMLDKNAELTGSEVDGWMARGKMYK
jgi:hypothetical protein